MKDCRSYSWNFLSKGINDMVILHFASIDNSKTSGVSIAVLQHVAAQGQYAETALINTNGIQISEAPIQLPFYKPFDVRALPKPFDRPDLAIFQECYRPVYLSIAKNLKTNYIPYVIVPHGELGREAQKKKYFKKKVANVLLFNRFAEHSAAIQCLSKREYEETTFGTKKFIGTNGVVIPKEKKEVFSSNGMNIVYIGRLDAYHKGLDLLLEAVRLSKSILLENNCRIELFGPDYAGRFEHVRSLIQENDLQDLVSLNHEIVGADKARKLLDADIFIQTSRFEGMPLGILEAMSYGLPCLVTEGTAVGEIISEANAGWVAKTNAQDIAKRLAEAVYDRSKWAEYGKNGRKVVQEKYSWDVVAADAVRYYKSILLS